MKSGGAAVVEVGRRRCHVAQARYPQDFGFWRGERMKDAVTLKQVAADIDTLMAGDTAERLEQLIAVKLLGRGEGGLRRRRRANGRTGSRARRGGAGPLVEHGGVGN
jgi:hypothetical protein